MSPTDPGTIERAMQLRRMMANYLHSMTPQERDRNMQVHLSQARGPIANVMLLRGITKAMLRIKRAQPELESDHE